VPHCSSSPVRTCGASLSLSRLSTQLHQGRAGKTFFSKKDATSNRLQTEKRYDEHIGLI
jgi:hypothetical protein